ncbi:hypothetical protein SAMN05428977_10191, partial [Nitrosomonas sp. Nm166]
MNPFSIFHFSARRYAELKVHLVKSLQQWLLKFCLCCTGMICLIFQAHAANPSPASTNTPAPATTTAPAATAA